MVDGRGVDGGEKNRNWEILHKQTKATKKEGLGIVCAVFNRPGHFRNPALGQRRRRVLRKAVTHGNPESPAGYIPWRIVSAIALICCTI